MLSIWCWSPCFSKPSWIISVSPWFVMIGFLPYSVHHRYRSYNNCRWRISECLGSVWLESYDELPTTFVRHFTLLNAFYLCNFYFKWQSWLDLLISSMVSGICETVYRCCETWGLDHLAERCQVVPSSLIKLPASSSIKGLPLTLSSAFFVSLCLSTWLYRQKLNSYIKQQWRSISLIWSF